MDEWLDRAAVFFDGLGEAHDRTAAEWGISPAFVIVGVVILVMVLKALRSLPTRRGIEAQMQRPSAPATAMAAVRAAELRAEAPDAVGEDEDALDASALPAPAGPASRTGSVVIALVGSGVLGGAAYFMSVAPERAPEWRSSIYLFGSLIALLGLGFLNAGVGGLFQRRVPGTDPAQWLRDARWSRDGTGPVASERIGSGAFSILLFAAYLAPFHSVLAAPFAHIAFWIAIALLDLLFVVCLVMFLHSLRSRWLGGRARLSWTGAPFFPGQMLRVRLETARALEGEVTVSLLCLKANGSTQALDAEPPDATEILRKECRVRMQRGVGGGAFADLAIAIPEEAPGTLRHAAVSIWWRLAVHMPIAGPDFMVTFPLPVYVRSP